MINILLAILTSFIITFFVTPILIRVIKNNAALMHDPEYRGSHKNPIPVGPHNLCPDPARKSISSS